MKSPKPFIDNETLREIRNQTDWKSLFDSLGLQRDKKSTDDDWWALSPFSQENHASFHLNDQGWYCHSTAQGGGVIELVQQVMGQQSGQVMNCYQAGQWLLDNGLSTLPSSPHDTHSNTAPDPDQTTRSEKEKKGGNQEDTAAVAMQEGAETEGKENHPIRQSLVSRLEPKHHEFDKRGISQKTCEYLGCGYLPESSTSSLAGWIVFQVRGVQETATGTLQPVILSHIGRALTAEQLEEDGKWHLYAGFYKTLELYNIDHLLLDSKAQEQAQEMDSILVVEGCFDVAKLVEAGIYNVVATFGANFSEQQAEQLEFIRKQTGIDHFRFWYDRDAAGEKGLKKALEILESYPSIQVSAFDWNMEFSSDVRPHIPIPSSITDVCECSVEQLQWLSERG